MNQKKILVKCPKCRMPVEACIEPGMKTKLICEGCEHSFTISVKDKTKKVKDIKYPDNKYQNKINTKFESLSEDDDHIALEIKGLAAASIGEHNKNGKSSENHAKKSIPENKDNKKDVGFFNLGYIIGIVLYSIIKVTLESKGFKAGAVHVIFLFFGCTTICGGIYKELKSSK